MTPQARYQAVIELLEAWVKPLMPASAEINADQAQKTATTPPLDRYIANYYRNRRYIGSGDRQFISGLLYGMIRHYRQILWWYQEYPFLTSPKDGVNGVSGGNEANGDKQISLFPLARRLLLIWLVRHEGLSLVALEQLWGQALYGPPSLTRAEKSWLLALASIQPSGLSSSRQTEDVQSNLPQWAWLKWQSDPAYGGEQPAWLRFLKSMGEEASVDIRVNQLKISRDALQSRLARAGVEATPTPFASLGLRLSQRHALTALAEFKQGLFEPQDEAAQLAIELCQPKPGQRVLDYCAGAGGKSLGLAAMMQNSGQIIALDNDDVRLTRAQPRLRRAGVTIAQTRVLDAATRKWLKRQRITTSQQASGFDLVLADVPCSGSGVWRRNPDQKWRLQPQDVLRLTKLQAEILDEVAPLVRLGGCLAYATCSLFREENDDQIQQFLSRWPQYDYRSLALPKGLSLGSQKFPTLTLRPDLHGCDGFYLALLTRRSL